MNPKNRAKLLTKKQGKFRSFEITFKYNFRCQKICSE